MVKIFVTGATGYIGGDALYAIVQAHPEYEITALVRNSDKGAQVAKDYPSIRMAYGDLDSAQVLIEEASRADIVCHFAHADHENAIRSIIQGLSSSPSTPKFLIHTSGTGILMFTDLRTNTFGVKSNLVYDDFENVDGVTSLPDDAPHRNVDKLVLAASQSQISNQTETSQEQDRNQDPDKTKINTAIVCPPCIYGRGRGPGNQISQQLPELCRASLKAQAGLYIGDGDAVWSTVHVHDLSALYLRLVEEAAAGGATALWSGKAPVWGSQGYFFAESGEVRWGDVAQWIAEAAHKKGLMEKVETRAVTEKEVGRKGAVLWGISSRSRARRARELFGWKPTGSPMEDDVLSTLEYEAKEMGRIKGHAEKVAESVY